MKLLITLSLLGAALLFTGKHEPKVIITNTDPELIPEGIAVHPQTGTIYLSSLNQNKIIAIDKDGTTRDLISSGQNGFMIGLGLKLDAGGKSLWAVSAYNDSTAHRTGLFQIDVQSGKVLQQFIRREEKNCFLNDLVLDRQGNIYITDSYQGSVFRWDARTKALERWLQNDLLAWANGIALSPDEQTLFVATGAKGILRIKMATKTISPIAPASADFYAVDGLAYYGNSLIGVIGWPQHTPQNHRVLRFHLTADNTLARTDTLDINNPHLDCPTTLAIRGDQLYVLAKTNLGVYNRHGESTRNIKDSLQKAVILQYPLLKE